MVHKDHNPDQYVKKAAAYVGASLSSILSGNPFSRDEFYHRIRTYIENGRYTKNMQAFSVPCTKFADTHDTVYDTVVIKSSHGAYLLVKTAAPALDEDGQPCNKPIHALLFSQYPDFLQDLFLKRHEPEWKPPSKEDIETKISVVAAHWESDIEQRNEETGEIRIVKSWVKTAINKHNTNFEENLKRHGSVLRDGAKMWRSGSSIFWLRRNSAHKNLFDVHYYSNPVYGQLSLFLTERALKNRVTRGLMKSFSVRLSDAPMTLRQADNFVSEKYAYIAQSIFNNRDPMDSTAPDHLAGKVGHIAKKIPVRTIQKMAHALFNVDKKSLLIASGVTLALTGLLWLMFSTFFFAAGAVSKGVSNLGMKGAQGLFRTIGKFASPIQTKTVNALNDMSALLAANKKNNIISTENAGMMLNHNYIGYMDPVQKQFLESTFPDMVVHTEEESEFWAKSVLLDTLGIQPGTIFTDVQMGGRTYLKAQQPNGLDVYYDPEEHVAIAHIVRAPYKGFGLEKPIERLFSQLPDGEHIIAVRQNENNQLETTSFASLNDIPETFIRRKSKSLHQINAETVDLDAIGSYADMRLYEFVTDKEEKKWRKTAHKQISKTLKETFKDKATIEPKIDHLCLCRCYEQAERNTHIIDDMPADNTPPLPADRLVAIPDTLPAPYANHLTGESGKASRLIL